MPLICLQTFLHNSVGWVTIKVTHFTLVNRSTKNIQACEGIFFSASMSNFFGKCGGTGIKICQDAYFFPLEPQNTRCNNNQTTHICLARIKLSCRKFCNSNVIVSRHMANIPVCPRKYALFTPCLHLQFRFYCLLKMQEILLEFIMGFFAYHPLQE